MKTDWSCEPFFLTNFQRCPNKLHGHGGLAHPISSPRNAVQVASLPVRDPITALDRCTLPIPLLLHIPLPLPCFYSTPRECHATARKRICKLGTINMTSQGPARKELSALHSRGRGHQDGPITAAFPPATPSVFSVADCQPGDQL